MTRQHSTITRPKIYWHKSNACFFGTDHAACWENDPRVVQALDRTPTQVTRCPCTCHKEKP